MTVKFPPDRSDLCSQSPENPDEFLPGEGNSALSFSLAVGFG